MSSNPTQLKWVDFKAMLAARGLSLQWRQVKKVYQLVAFDGAFRTESVIRIDSPANADQLDFETNYKNTPAKPVMPADFDGSALQRPKYAPPGWSYHMRSLEFESAKRGSLRCKKLNPTTKANTEWGDVTLKFFSTAGAELVQGASETDSDFQIRLDVGCAFTQVDFEPLHDIEIVGGGVRVIDILVMDVYLSVIGAPDLPETYGGSKFFISGVNLNFLPENGQIAADGRTSKKLTYDPTYHTNKLRALFEHPAGFKTRFQVTYELYRP